MAALDVAATIAGLIELSGTMLSAGYGFLARVKRAPSQVRALLNEVSSIDVILDAVRSTALDRTHTDSMLAARLIESGKVRQCQDIRVILIIILIII